MRRDADFFESKDARLIYIARRLRDALRLESLLTQAGIDYGVESDTYRGGLIFPSERVGAFFYVLPETEDLARRVLAENRFKPQAEPGS